MGQSENLEKFLGTEMSDQSCMAQHPPEASPVKESEESEDMRMIYPRERLLSQRKKPTLKTWIKD